MIFFSHFFSLYQKKNKVDDAFCFTPSCLSPKEQNSQYLQTLKFLQSMVTKICHHYSFHIALTTQMPLSTSGSSAISQAYRQIRTNCDSVIIWPLINRDLMTLLNQIFSGESYTFVKDLFKGVENDFTEAPADSRLHRAYLQICLSPQTNKALKFR